MCYNKRKQEVAMKQYIFPLYAKDLPLGTVIRIPSGKSYYEYIVIAKCQIKFVKCSNSRKKPASCQMNMLRSKDNE